MLNYPQYDTMSGIGVTAHYDMDFRPWPSYGDAYWWFGSQAGWSQSSSPDPDNMVLMVGPMYYTQCINYGLESMEYTDYQNDSDPDWGQPNGANHWCWFRSNEIGTIENPIEFPCDGSLHSVEAVNFQQFCWVQDPDYQWAIEVYTTNPQSPGPNSFSWLTAWDWW